MVNEAFILLPLMLFVVLGLDRYLKWHTAKLARERQEEAAAMKQTADAGGKPPVPPSG